MTEFLDTSIVVRYLTEDPPDRVRRARAVIEGPALLTLTDATLAAAARDLDAPIIHTFDQGFPAEGVEIRIP